MNGSLPATAALQTALACLYLWVRVTDSWCGERALQDNPMGEQLRQLRTSACGVLALVRQKRMG